MTTKESTWTGQEGGDVAFLVGVGRSGTTLLYKLLCLHPEIAYISNYENRLGWLPSGLACRLASRRLDAKLRTWFRKDGNAYFVDRPWLTRAFPTPHEGEAVFDACGLQSFPDGNYRPGPSTADCLRRRFTRIRQGARAAVFLSKCTTNNHRILPLAAVFPEARYIHLIRDGREVTQSSSAVEWWDHHVLWWDGRTPLEMERDGEDRLVICARNWVRELQELKAALSSIDQQRVLELRFEDLLCDPLSSLDRAVRFLGLECSAQYRSAIAALDIRPMMSQWPQKWTQEQTVRVTAELQQMLQDLGYTSGA